MAATIKFFSHTERSLTTAHFQRLAECVGIDCEFIENEEEEEEDLFGSITREMTPHKKSAIALDVGGLQNQCNLEQIGELAAYLGGCQTDVLLLVSELGETVDQIVRALTNGAVNGVASVGCPGRVSFPKGSEAFSEELASHSYEREPDPALGLNPAVAGQMEEIMLLDQVPTFGRVRVGNANIFIWATNSVFDVSRMLAAEKEFELAADQYIPVIIFLRFAFGDLCWRNPVPGAGIVIDDPLLKVNYGFINFPKLLESARRCRYHITLAFIPWNYWRSRPAQSQMFLDHADCFSICSHGCDHTKSEFGAPDYDGLLRKNFVAHRRMEQHRKRTGLLSEPLMVCPQELYSVEAMRAFADSRQFIALVCTACMPRNLMNPSLRGSDLLFPAQDSFFGVPVFKRHYWSDISVFAMALFLGKPAILVEHHEFFQGGPAKAERFVSELAKVQPRIKWATLTETVTRTHLRRLRSKDQYEVRFFTDDFKFLHIGETAAEYRLVRRIPLATRVRNVTVNGVTTPFVREGELLTLEIQSAAQQNLHVRVEVDPIQPAKAFSPGIRYHAEVVLRRGLSEFRDNVIVRNKMIMHAAKLMMKTLRQTSS